MKRSICKNSPRHEARNLAFGGRRGLANPEGMPNRPTTNAVTAEEPVSSLSTYYNADPPSSSYPQETAIACCVDLHNEQEHPDADTVGTEITPEPDPSPEPERKTETEPGMEAKEEPVLEPAEICFTEEPSEVVHQEDTSCSEEIGKAEPCAEGLLRYKKWWFIREVNLCVEGDMLTGVPIFLYDDTLRVINEDCSYFIPMRKVSYIRTPDGLKNC